MNDFVQAFAVEGAGIIDCMCRTCRILFALRDAEPRGGFFTA